MSRNRDNDSTGRHDPKCPALHVHITRLLYQGPYLSMSFHACFLLISILHVFLIFKYHLRFLSLKHWQNTIKNDFSPLPIGLMINYHHMKLRWCSCTARLWSTRVAHKKDQIKSALCPHAHSYWCPWVTKLTLLLTVVDFFRLRL